MKMNKEHRRAKIYLKIDLCALVLKYNNQMPHLILETAQEFLLLHFLLLNLLQLKVHVLLQSIHSNYHSFPQLPVA